MPVRSYKYRISPNREQARLLEIMLKDFCNLYNAGLQQRIEAYRRQGLTLRYNDQAKELKSVRDDDSEGIGRWSFSAMQQVLRRLDQTYKAFFRRKHGFPRFRAAARYHAATFRVGDGLMIRKDQRLSVVGIPDRIKVIWHRDLPPEAKLGTAILTRQQNKWYVVFSVEADFAEACGVGTVGIDLGLNSLIATSDGETVEAPRYARKAQKAQRRRQRALARCQRGSKRRLKAKARLASGLAKTARQRRAHLHKVSRSIVFRYGKIAFENLNMTGLTKSMLARSIYDAAWSTLVQLVQYKAASAGAEIKMVDPRGTSQTCPCCGIIKVKTLKDRRHICECGADLDRDVAAAIVIRERAFGQGPGHGLRRTSQRVAA